MQNVVIMISGRSPLEEIGGGHCSYVRAHAYAAVAAGYEVHVFCVSDYFSGVHDTPYGRVHHASAMKTPPRQRYIKKLAGPISENILENKDLVDRAVVVHSFGVWAYAGKIVCDRLAQQGQHLPHVMSMYTAYREEALAQLKAVTEFNLFLVVKQFCEWISIRFSASACEKQAYHSCDAVVVNYESVKKLLHKIHGYHPNLRILPYGPETAFHPNAPAHDITPATGVPVVMTITLQRPKKGVVTLLDAFARLKKEKVLFRGRVVGGGTLKTKHEQYSNALGLTDCVEFTGFVDAVDPWLKTSSIYVQPSIREESGALALLEAMRIRLPVICSAVDGMAEDIRNEIDGLTVPPGDAIALASAIKRLINDEVARTKFARAARQRFDERHAPEIFSPALKDLYEHL